MKPLYAMLVLCLPALALANGKPSLLVAPLEADKNIAAPVAQGYENALLKVAGASTAVLSRDKTSDAMGKASVGRDCTTDECAKKLADFSNARFVVFSKVLSSDDDMYVVELILYDGAKSERVAEVKKECELCADLEVNETISEAFADLKAALAAPAPVVKLPPPPPVQEETKSDGNITVVSTPEGATVKIGKVEKGKTPTTFTLKPGTYSIGLEKEGFLKTVRKVNVLDRKVNLKVKLKTDPNYIPPVAVVPTVPVKNEPAKTKPETDATKAPTRPVADVEPIGSAYDGVALGLILGGAVVSGVGTWLVLLDGTVTCSDRGLRECPDVYNTKGGGLAAVALGSAAVGAGIALFVEEFISSEREMNKLRVGAGPTDGGATFNLFGRF